MKTVINLFITVGLWSFLLFLSGIGCDKKSEAPAREAYPPPPDGMVLIPAGEFEMGSNDGSDDEQPIHTVYVDAFYMDTHEVTHADFKRFVLANPQWQKSRIPKSLHTGKYLFDWDDSNNYPVGMANYPVESVCWYAAMAYAEWAGKRLPTEAEWEKAARGGLKGKKYPPGSKVDPNLVIFSDPLIFEHSTSVGSYPANGYGLFDMEGNAWEWCLDEYNPYFYSMSPARNPVAYVSPQRPSRHPLPDVNTIANLDAILNNYTAVDVKSRRVYRGGTGGSPKTRHVRLANRNGSTPAYTHYYLGFRCAKSVSPEDL